MRQRARKGEGERLRGEILEAADRLLLASGDEEAVSVRAVAREVGCTPPAIYLHFHDRRELLLAVCERYFADLDRRVTAVFDAAGDPLEGLRRGGAAYVGWGVENPEPYRMIFMTRRDDAPPFRVEDTGAGATAFRHLMEHAQRCIDAGRVAHGDAFLVATGLWSVVHGITSLVISTPHFPVRDLDTVVSHVVDTYLAGLAPAQRETGGTPAPAAATMDA